MKETLLIFALALATVAAQAENLTKRQEGRVAIAQCYSACMDRSQRTALALYERVDRLSDLLISDEYFALTAASRDDVVALEETSICALAQDHVRGMDACHVGCVDVEMAYGVGLSHARTRFLHTFNAERNALRDVGLWAGHANSPSSGPLFDNACDRYWDGADSGGAAQGRVGAVPALMAKPHGKAQRTKAPEHAGDGKAPNDGS